MSSDTTYELAMLLKVDTDKNGLLSPITARLHAELVGVTADRKIRNLGHQYDETDALADLQVNALLSNDEERAWGWGVDYRQVYRVELEQAEKMVKVLRKVKRGLDKATEQFGYSPDFHSYMTRIAHILGVKHFVVQADENSRRGGMYDESQWRFLTAPAAQSWLLDVEHKHGKRAVTSA